MTQVDFIVEPGESDRIDIPCEATFPIAGSHLNLEFALEQSICQLRPRHFASYSLPDGSIFEAHFDRPEDGDGSLHEVIWYRNY